MTFSGIKFRSLTIFRVNKFFLTLSFNPSSTVYTILIHDSSIYLYGVPFQRNNPCLISYSLLVSKKFLFSASGVQSHKI